MRLDERGAPREVLVDPAPAGATEGGPGGGLFELGCPEGQLLGGVFGGAWDFVDRIGVQCVEPLVGDPHAGVPTLAFEPGARIGPEGGPGGAPFEHGCAPDRAATGMYGRAALYVDAFGLLCAAASAPR